MRISYVQRCYYQPVTEYVRKSYYGAGHAERHELLLRAGDRVPVQHLLRPLHRLPAEGLHAVHLVPAAKQVQLGDELRRAVRDGAGDDAQAGDRPAAGGELLLPALPAAVPAGHELVFPPIPPGGGPRVDETPRRTRRA